MRIEFTETTNPPGKLADVEVIFPTFTDEQRRNLETVAALTYTQPEAIAMQDAARLALAFEGLRLIGFALWRRHTGAGLNVTFPARQYSVNGERRSFALLRPLPNDAAPVDGQANMRDRIVSAWDARQRAAGAA